jgi:acyl-coenzyme A synthetase/AMP-(fatty) acid ligase
MGLTDRLEDTLGLVTTMVRAGSTEVEKTLAAHPDVNEDGLNYHVRGKLASYKVPRTITVLTELPRGSTGKILRRELEELVTTNGE